MNNELVETNIEKTNAKYLLSEEEIERLGINPSGKISGAAAFLYEGKSLESNMSD